MTTMIRIALMSKKEKVARLIEIEAIFKANKDSETFYQFGASELRQEFETIMALMEAN